MAGGSVFLISSLICFAYLLFLTFTEAVNGGFIVDLIQRDSPLSPSYDPSETNADRLHNAFLRSISRMNHFKTILSVPTKALQSPVVPSGGEYFMNISIGTPKVELIGIADTGSDLTWIQCKPCEHCYKQKPPIFDSNRSSTYRTVDCKTGYCTALELGQRCDGKRNVCGYSYTYADNSFTEGNLAVENFAIASSNGRQVTLPKIVFGCGHKNGGLFDEAGSGIVGLGRGPLSLVSQLDHSTQGIFSYCLVPPSSGTNVRSKIKFGSEAFVSGSDVVSTCLVDKQPVTYYWVTLEAISVGNKRLPYTNSSNGNMNAGAAEEGNMIIDSGTTVTFLDAEFFDKLATALEKAIGSERVSDPRGMFGACFKADNESGLPIITVHFRGADIKLQPLNTFIRLQEGLVCFTMIPSDSIAILGNLSQMNFLVGYDLKKKTVSFKPADCSKH